MHFSWHRTALVLLAAAWVCKASPAADIPRGEHPRPGFRRAEWLSLNGTWQFCFDPDNQGLQERWQEGGRRFDRRIVIPFPWQSKLSGIGDTSGQQVGWYRRTVTLPETWRGQRVWLRFGAVDWEARVWVNGREVGRHEGGYTPFEFDVTDVAPPGSEATIVLRAYDATDPELPLGKQVPRWYTATSGVWQTVWLEARPATYVDRLRLVPRLRGPQWALDVELEAAGADGPARVEIASPDRTVRSFEEPMVLKQGRGRLRATLDVDSPRLWTPEDPHLYELQIRLSRPANADQGSTAPGAGGRGRASPDAAPHPGTETDTVDSYFGLRTIARGKHDDLPHEVILLNGEPIYLRGALDQSFNPEGIYTAPSDEFLRRDLEIAKRCGFNYLRIHIKSEEPRRLYWADRLGVLIMEDMPCTFEQSARARRAWEETMRATIRRDRNHPAVIAWCLFNETWGLGGDGYKQDQDTQQWVLRMWKEVKQQLDSTRLVEDNSPCRYDHVQTDLNSWHFYIDDYVRARDHIAEVVSNTRPGSPFNYVPGRTQDTAPLMNSEYGAVSARGGDRDISWGFRYLTTQLRRHELIQGYVYTELTDVEWEHNGMVSYDRSPKEFGYDAFVPGMGPAELQGADFVGFDAPPTVELAPEEQLTIPVFVSHFSRRTSEPILRWQIVGTDSLGRAVTTQPQTRRVVWQPYRVTFQKPLQIRPPTNRAFVGALTLELLGEKDRRIAANFVNLVVRPRAVEPSADESAAASADCPRVEVLAPRLVAVRFDPGEFASFRTDDSDLDWMEDRGKFRAPGPCEVEYHLALPPFVREAIPAEIVLMAELATKADDQLLDWPAQRRPLDYPQTQQRKYPGSVGVHLEDREVWQVELPNDPADARGVLSHQARHDHGSYGYLVRKQADLRKHEALREALRSKPFTTVTFRSRDGRGLSVYGRRLGRYPIDPTFIIRTAHDLKQPAGWTSGQPVTTHRLLDRSRLVEGVPTGESHGHSWRYTTNTPAADWKEPGFDDSSWQTGLGAFGRGAPPGVHVRSRWDTPDIWLRGELSLPARPVGMLIRYFHDEDMEVFVNGKELLREVGYARQYRQRALSKEEMALFRQGRNVIAIHCRQTRGGQAIDLGLSWIEIREEEHQEESPQTTGPPQG